MEEDTRQESREAAFEDIGQKQRPKPGRLKIFFGYAPGVGKTYAMLDDAREQLRAGTDVWIGFVEPQNRPETLALLAGLPALPPKTFSTGGLSLQEFDLDAALARKSGLILLDGLAHQNAPGSRNKKRYQDIEELLAAGIDVYTTADVQHIESLSDVVQDIIKSPVRDTVPDSVFDRADKVKLVDIDPDELLRRLKDGKFHPPGANGGRGPSFSRESLRLLREIAMRKVADRLSLENQNDSRAMENAGGMKLLVCIGPSPSSARCIRWTARSAEAFHAPWVAVYVQDRDSQRLTPKQEERLRQNMDLAEKLGAQIVTIAGRDVPAAVAEYARISGITNIVIGKSRRRKTLYNLFEPDFEDKLIARVPGVEVHIIPDGFTGHAHPGPGPALLRGSFLFSWPDTFKAIGLLAAATLAAFAIRAMHPGDQNIIIVYIFSVLLVSRVTAGYAYGIAASLLSVLAFDFFFAAPYFSFAALSGYPITFLIMLLMALITSALTVRIKAQMRTAVERERHAEVLYEISNSLLITRGWENIAAVMNKHIVALFGRPAVFYTHDPALQDRGGLVTVPEGTRGSLLKTRQEQEAACWTFANLKPAGAGTDTLFGAVGYYLPIVSQGRALGVMGLECGKSPLDHNQFLLLRMIASQAAMALERQQLSDKQRGIMVEAEKEKMRSNLLRAISHDLRTPLTGIFGASSALLENGESIGKETHDRLLSNIREDSQWLTRMVENLLSVTRIREGSVNMAKAPEAAEEIVAEAVRRVRTRFPERAILVKAPQTLLMVPMDGTLIVQVLINLLENALRHSPREAQVQVEVRREGSNAVFEVVDHGEGIDPYDLPYLFEGYQAGRERGADSSRGMGIGLSICKTIVSAHNGDIQAANREAGGAAFWFTLPLGGGE